MQPIHKLENQKYLKTLESNKDIDKYFSDQARFLTAKIKIDTIDNFNEEFDFLNNDFDSPVMFDLEIYPNISNAYQAARTNVVGFRKRFQEDLTPFDLYDLAKQIPNPPNWDNDKLIVMEKLLRDKFVRVPLIKEKLKSTGDRELVNMFKDESPANLFWGKVGNKGDNHLGKLLMSVRKSIQENTDIDDWLTTCLDLPKDRALYPVFNVKILKDGSTLESFKMNKKACYLCGNSTKADFQMTHPSISRIHCAFGFDQKLGIFVVDLGSTNSTFVDGNKLDSFIPFVVKKPDFSLVCGSSTRINEIDVDFQAVKRYLERKKANISEDKEHQSEIRPTKLHISGQNEMPKRSRIERLFDHYGDVKYVTLFKDDQRGKDSWFGFVKFYSPKAIDRVLREPGIYMDGERIAVKIALPKNS